MFAFLIVSILVTADENLKPRLFTSATISKAYTSAGLTSIL